VGYPFASDDSYCVATLPFGAAQTTETLRITGFKTAPLLPVSATIDSMHVAVERSMVGDLVVTETTVQPKDIAASLGTNRSTSYVLTGTDASQIFNASALLTVAEINNGDFGVDLKYTQEDWLAIWNDPLNWTIGVSGGGTSPTMTVTVTYIGPGSPPSKCFVNITSEATLTIVSTEEGSSLTAAATGTIDDGFTEVDVFLFYDSMAEEDNPTESSETTEKVEVTLTAGTGTYVVNRLASGSLTSGTGWDVEGTYTGSAVHAIPTASTVRVDNVTFSICYTVPAVGGGEGVEWRMAVFTADSRYLAIRSTGELDLIEYDFRDGEFIGGENRDGGYQMPDWFVTTQKLSFDGRTGRLNGTQVNTLGSNDVFLTQARVGDGSFVSGTGTGTSASRWTRFPLTQLGITHDVKVSGDESAEGIEALTIEYQLTSKGKAR